MDQGWVVREKQESKMIQRFWSYQVEHRAVFIYDGEDSRKNIFFEGFGIC